MEKPPGHTDDTASEARRKVDLLKKFIEKSIGDVGKKRKLNQRKATAVKVSVLCLSGAATILLGLNLGPVMEVSLKNTAFALSSMVTVLSALEPFFNYRGLWVEHERANAAFFKVKDRLGYYVEGRSDVELDMKEIDRFYTEYENVWSALNQAWSRQRLQNSETGKRPFESQLKAGAISRAKR